MVCVGGGRMNTERERERKDIDVGVSQKKPQSARNQAGVVPNATERERKRKKSGKGE